MKPIETWYGGRRYRSRLEARWAVFFDVARIRFEYEPEGFDFGNGLLYLPDFWLPGQDAWAEIKGPKPSARDIQKCTALASHSGKRVFMFAGQFESELPTPATLFTPRRYADGFVEEDEPYYWAECFDCNTVGLTLEGDWSDLSCNCEGTSVLPWEEPDGRIRSAHAAALAARFEHADRQTPGFSKPREVMADAKAGLLHEVTEYRRKKKFDDDFPNDGVA
jgi:hypothetical protein